MSLLPDWLLVSLTGAALCWFVLGRWRWAAVLAAPAVLRFLVWPLALYYMARIPLILLVMAAVAALPFLMLRLLRRLLILASSERAADHALGDLFGSLLKSAARRAGRRRR